MPPMLRRFPRWAYALAVLVVLAAGGLGAYLKWGRASEHVSKPDAEFTVPQDTPKPKKRKPKDFVWPMFGYTPDRSKYFPTKIHPPFKKIWRHRADSLLEFPPVLARNTLFYVTNK